MTEDENTARVLLNAPSILSYLPLNFASGYYVDSFHLGCALCKKDIAPHGKLVWMNRCVVQLSVAGYCQSCHKTTIAFSRIYDDGRVICQDRQGNWNIYGRIAVSPIAKAYQALKRMLIRIWRM